MPWYLPAKEPDGILKLQVVCQKILCWGSGSRGIALPAFKKDGAVFEELFRRKSGGQQIAGISAQ